MNTVPLGQECQPTPQQATVDVLELDISRLQISAQGFEPFYAPLHYDCLLAFRDALLEGCFGALAGMLPKHHEEVDLALLAILEFLREAMALFYARAVISRARACGMSRFSVPEGFGLLRAGVTGKYASPRNRRTWKLLSRGISDPYWRRPLRLMRNFLVRDEFSRRPLPGINLRRNIVTPAVSPLIRRHARCVGERVYLVPARTWFRPLPHAAVACASAHALTADVQAVLINAVAAAYTAAGVDCPEDDRAYLQRWLEDITGLCRLYLQRLLANPEQVPARLWTGTGGIIWMRLLRLACRRLGGEVTGHEHGTASGQVVNVSLGLWEFEFCDHFVTFTSELADYYRQPRHHRYRLSQPGPDIAAIPALEGCGETVTNTAAEQETTTVAVRRVMYVNTVYFGDSPGLTPAFPDVVWVDWQARLISVLKEAHFEVLLKPHPECRLRPASGYGALADQVLWERFEAVQAQADAYLFDWPQTTTLVQAMATSKPIVIVDFGFTVLESEAETRLRRRCAVVKGWVDDTGRAQVDHGALRDAFRRATGLVGNREYFLSYQGGMQGV